MVEFEDFSTCWPADQLEAKGLVAQIQKLAGKKDSFTRMGQEREAERREHRNKKRKELEERHRRFLELDRIKEEFYGLFGAAMLRSTPR